MGPGLDNVWDCDMLLYARQRVLRIAAVVKRKASSMYGLLQQMQSSSPDEFWLVLDFVLVLSVVPFYPSRFVILYDVTKYS